MRVTHCCLCEAADLLAPCAALKSSPTCQNKSCPENYCYNKGYCYISQELNCQPTCACLPAFTDTRCFVAGNNFTPTLKGTTRCLPLHTQPPSPQRTLGVKIRFLRLTEQNSKFFSGDSKLQTLGASESSCHPMNHRPKDLLRENSRKPCDLGR